MTHETCPYNLDMSGAGRPPAKPATKFGARLATMRKEAGLSQAQVAEALAVPQRTISFYEREAQAIPSNLLQPLAELLGVTIGDIIGIESDGQRRRGPKSKIERQLDVVRRLPRSEQQFVSKLLDQLLTGRTT